MRRTTGTTGLLVPALLALTLLLSPTVAAADEASPDPSDQLVLAADGGVSGPEPQDRMREDNPARELAGYEDRETQFTWGAAWILLFLGAGGLVTLVGLYYLLVHRPAQQATGNR